MTRVRLQAARLHIVLILVAVLCAASHGVGAAPLRLAVLYFDNNSVTDAEMLEPFRKGLADTLIGDLGRVAGLQVIERERLDAVYAELQLSASDAIDKKTAQKLGNVLGVQALVLGCFTAVGPMLRIDARVIDVETSEVLAAREVCGNSEDFFSLEESLVESIIQGLGLTMDGGKASLQKPREGSFEAVTLYSQGLDYFDKKEFGEAAARFERALAVDPDYEDAGRMLKKTRERMARESGK